MKILIVNNLYPPHSRGGAETAVVNEAQSLRDAGHEVSVLTTAPFQGWRSLQASEWKEDGIRIFRFYPLNLFWYRHDHQHGFLVRALWYIGNLWGWHPVSVFKKTVKDVRPDVVHLHNINGISYRLPHVCDRLKIKSVFTVHAVHYAVPSGIVVKGQTDSTLDRLFAWLLRGRLRSHALVTAPSQWLLDFYAARGFFKGQTTAVVPNPLLPSVGGTASHLPQATCRFLYVGQLEAYKGLNVLLAALSRLPPEARWQLDIVGTGSLLAQLRKQRDQHVSVRGRLNPEEVATAYRAADALIVPSLCAENAPMVIAEANAQGLPVIAAAIGGIPEMVTEGENGLLFEAGNIEELTMHCRRVIEHPEIFAALRDSAVASAARYAPDKVTGEYLEIFQNR